MTFGMHLERSKNRAFPPLIQSNYCHFMYCCATRPLNWTHHCWVQAMLHRHLQANKRPGISTQMTRWGCQGIVNRPHPHWHLILHLKCPETLATSRKPCYVYLEGRRQGMKSGPRGKHRMSQWTYTREPVVSKVIIFPHSDPSSDQYSESESRSSSLNAKLLQSLRHHGL